MRAAVAIDDWKLAIFERHLKEAGYEYERGPGLSIGTLHLYVEYADQAALERVVRAAARDAQMAGGTIV